MNKRQAAKLAKAGRIPKREPPPPKPQINGLCNFKTCLYPTQFKVLHDCPGCLFVNGCDFENKGNYKEVK